MRLIARATGLVFSLTLLGVWLWFCHDMVSLALDYPIRCAGLVRQHPPVGSAGFFLECTVEIGRMMFATSPYWLLPFSLVVLLLVRSLQIQATIWRVSVALGCLLLPLFLFACGEILRGWNYAVIQA